MPCTDVVQMLLYWVLGMWTACRWHAVRCASHLPPVLASAPPALQHHSSPHQYYLTQALADMTCSHAACLPAGRPAALAYAKQHFSPFQHSRLKDIQRLMGCLLYYGREGQGAEASSRGSSRMETDGPGGSSPGASPCSPYEDLLSDRQWEEVQQQFVKHACSLLGRVGGGAGAASGHACVVHDRACPALLLQASAMACVVTAASMDHLHAATATCHM